MLAFCCRTKETLISTSPFSTFLRYNQLTSSYQKQNFSQSSSSSFCNLIGSRLLSVTGFSGQTLSGWIEIFGLAGQAGLAMFSLVHITNVAWHPQEKSVTRRKFKGKHQQYRTGSLEAGQQLLLFHQNYGFQGLHQSLIEPCEDEVFIHKI